MVFGSFLLVFKSNQVLRPGAFPQAGVGLSAFPWTPFKKAFYFKKKMKRCISLGKWIVVCCTCLIIKIQMWPHVFLQLTSFKLSFDSFPLQPLKDFLFCVDTVAGMLGYRNVGSMGKNHSLWNVLSLTFDDICLSCCQSCSNLKDSHLLGFADLGWCLVGK